MIGRSFSVTLVALGCLATSASPAQACKLFGCGRTPTTTFYTPYVAAYAPVAPACPTQQVVNYMPTTAFRTVMVNRPVVSYMPQSACDACGRATTVMRPVTSFVAQPQLVPYTTFRPVVTTVAQPCCAAPATVSYAPAVSAAPACCGSTPTPTLSSYSPAPVAAPAAPACCGAATPTPSLSSYSPAPTTTTIVQPSTTPATTIPSGSTGSTLNSLQPTPDPTLNGGSYPSSTTTPPSSTFAPESNGSSTNGSGASVPQSRVLLPAFNNGTTTPSNSSLNDRPRGLDPEVDDRTTAIPLRSSFTVRQASLVVPTTTPVKAEPKLIDDGGWTALEE